MPHFKPILWYLALKSVFAPSQLLLVMPVGQMAEKKFAACFFFGPCSWRQTRDMRVDIEAKVCFGRAERRSSHFRWKNERIIWIIYTFIVRSQRQCFSFELHILSHIWYSQRIKFPFSKHRVESERMAGVWGFVWCVSTVLIIQLHVWLYISLNMHTPPTNFPQLVSAFRHHRVRLVCLLVCLFDFHLASKWLSWQKSPNDFFLSK